MTASDLISFENRIRAHWEAGAIPSLLHLCGGNEDELVAFFRAHVQPGDWIFSTHRNHYHALLAGIPADKLEADILAGHSMFTFSREHNFYSSAILAGTCGIAAGVAWDLKSKAGPLGSPHHVFCFLGDGAEEEGHFYEAALFVEAHDLPCTFIIEDNNRQVDTDKATRRGLGFTADRPLDNFSCVDRYRYAPTYPHAGSGAKPGTITFQAAAIERLRLDSQKS